MGVDVERIRELSIMIINLKKAADELVETWLNHADGCKYVVQGDDDVDVYEMGCAHADPRFEPTHACMYDNCPLLK